MMYGDKAAPTISVAIPTHNRQELLRRVLAALAKQTYPMDQFEVIVVVDGSDDGTEEMLKALQNPYELRVLQQPQGGPSRARNVAIAAARGQVIIFLDDDVIPVPQFVSTHAAIHQHDPEAVVVGRLLAYPIGERPGWERWEEFDLDQQFDQMREGRLVLNGTHFYTGNASVGRRSLAIVGNFDVALKYQEDCDLGQRLEMAGAHFYFGDRAAGYHCGYRASFSIWCRRHYNFGVYNFVRHNRNGDGQLPAALRDARARLRPVTKLLLTVAIGRPIVSQLMTTSIHGIVTTADWLHAWSISRCGYSALVNLHHWWGIHDALGAHAYPSSIGNADVVTEPRQSWTPDGVPSPGLSNGRG